MNFECFGDDVYDGDTLEVSITDGYLDITVCEGYSTATILINDTENVKEIARVLVEYLKRGCSNE